MDGIRGEVSNKIRSAIKAKLLELGAYVDDELPDYIMVMVANKRSKQQMEEDLLLFLGDSTATFTAWLHSVLNKLQQVTVNNSELKKSSESKKRASSEDHKKDKKKKAKREKESERTPEKGKSKDRGTSKASVEVSENDVREKVKLVKNEPADITCSEDETHHVEQGKKNCNLQSATQQKVSNEHPVAKKHHEDKTIEDEDDDFINLKADVEADLWGETEESPPIVNNPQISKPTAQAPTVAAVEVALSAPPVPSTTAPSKSGSKDVSSNVPSSADKPSLEKVSDPKPVARIIKISETLRQEQETLNPVKHSPDPQFMEKSRKSRIPSPIIFHSEKIDQKEDDEEIFGRQVAHELRQLSQAQKNLAKRRIKQALVKRVLLSHVVNQKTCGSDVRRGGRNSSIHHPESSSRRLEQREVDHLDLRQTLNKEGRKDKERGRNSVIGRGRERERVRERETTRERETARERERDRKHPKEQHSVRRHQSSLASVVHPKAHLSEDEEKTDTSVASVVRVKPRPRLPAALQANRSLILKAVAEAQKSVHRVPLRPDPALKISSKELNLNQRKKLDVVSNGGTRTRKTNEVLNDQAIIKKQMSRKQNEGQRNSSVLPPREALMKMSVTVPRERTSQNNRDVALESEDGSVLLDSPMNILVQIPTSPLAPESTEPLDPAQTEKVIRWIESVEEANKSDTSSHGDRTPDEQQNNNEENNLETSYHEIDTNQINLSTDTEEVLEPEAVLNASNDCSTDRATLTQWSDDGDPQFVVTLDGLDPDFVESFDKEENITELVEQSVVTSSEKSVNVPKDVEEDERDQQEQELRLREELLKQQAVNRENQVRQELLKQQALAKEQNTAVSAPVTRSSIEKNKLKRSASPDKSGAPPSKVVVKISTPDRCKFWPTCRHGDKCEFYHPTVPCKLFPKCKFADRCLYIHPNCRFNSSCSRVDCPYTHFGPRPAVSCTLSPPGAHPGGQVIKQACKFYPNCNNRSCPFLHPTVCRFGLHCTKLNCQFIHSDKVLPTKHKWVRM